MQGNGLPPPVPGETFELHGRAGRIAGYTAGNGEPVLLIHSINAAASAYEIRPIYERLLAHRRVVAIDLPGFGRSERGPRRYDARLYTDAIHDALDRIASVTGGPVCDALALSLSSEFLARAATERPVPPRSLALITPTGFSSRDATRPKTTGSREIPGLHAVLEGPPWRQALFDLLVSRRSIRYFLKRTFGREDVDEGLVDYCWRTAHQPGARHAPYAFVSGRLFTKGIRLIYEQLAMPVWLTTAAKGDFRDFSGLDWVRDRRHWLIHDFPTGALPQFEQPDAFAAAYRSFLQAAGHIQARAEAAST